MQDNETSKRERVIRGVGRTVTDAVVKGTDEAAAVAGNIKETIKSKTSSERQNRDNVVMVRVDKDTLNCMDDLIEAGVAASRSEAANYLITEGIKARAGFFDTVAAKVEEIRRAKEELRQLRDEEFPQD